MIPVEDFFIGLNRKCVSWSTKKRYHLSFRIAEKIGVDLNNLDQDKVDQIFFHIVNNGFSNATKITEWKAYKTFIRRYYPNIDLKPYIIPKQDKPPQILTIEEMEKMINRSKSFRNQVLIALLYESGCRIGELLSLKKENIEFDSKGAILIVNGKTGWRRIRVVNCANILKRYVKDKEGLLFPVCDNFVRRVLKRLAVRCNIKKRVYPHLFRHTRATHLARHLTEPEMRMFFGWSKESKMTSVYVHLSGRDLDEKVCSLYGK